MKSNRENSDVVYWVIWIMSGSFSVIYTNWEIGLNHEWFFDERNTRYISLKMNAVPLMWCQDRIFTVKLAYDQENYQYLHLELKEKAVIVYAYFKYVQGPKV